MSKTFSDHEFRTVEAIIRTFETGKPAGNYSAVAVLNDGAGISYGVGQFTHRSGSLAAVVGKYLDSDAAIERDELLAALPLLRLSDQSSIARAANDQKLKRALAAAGRSSQMRDAQDGVLRERYLMPAIRECRRRRFSGPLSLAVVYDSMVHGSFSRIAGRVVAIHGERA